MKKVSSLFAMCAALGFAEEKPVPQSLLPVINGITQTVEVYKQTPQGDLEIFIHTPDRTASEKLPALLYFHGGGWKNGHPRSLRKTMSYYADRGMVAIAVQYRVSETHGTTPEESLLDAKSAYRWVVENAVRLNIDTNRIVTGGGSAGGHLAVALYLCDNIDEPDASIEIKPAGYILFNPVLDSRPDQFSIIPKELYEDISPLKNIRKEKAMAPSVVMFGDQDKLFDGTKLFVEELGKLGVHNMDVYIYPGHTHTFFNLAFGGVQIESDTTWLAEKFLQDHGFITGEPVAQSFEKELNRYRWNGKE